MAHIPQDARLVAASTRLYRLLLALYPACFRCEYGDEMARAFRDECREAYRRHGLLALLILWPPTLADLMRTSAAERFDNVRRPRSSRCGRGMRHAVLYGARHMVLPRRGVPAIRSHADRFTGRVREVLRLAQEETLRLRRASISTEHLLLGLLREEGGIGAEVLHHLGVTLEGTRADITRISGIGTRAAISGEVGLTPRAKRAIELAVDEARLLGHRFVGTEHLLLGLLREGEGVAAHVLSGEGVTLQHARELVARVMQELGDTSTT